MFPLLIFFLKIFPIFRYHFAILIFKQDSASQSETSLSSPIFYASFFLLLEQDLSVTLLAIQID